MLGDFAPGRGLSPACLQLRIPKTRLENPSALYNYTGSCILEKGSNNFSVAALKNLPEYTKILANSSNLNRIFTNSNGSMILPANPPVSTNFEATTFGSSTTCHIVTDLCDWTSVTQPYASSPDAMEKNSGNSSLPGSFSQKIHFQCKPHRASIKLTGSVSVSRDLKGNHSDSGGTSFEQFAQRLVYYKNSSMSAPNPSLLPDGPTTWFALIFGVESHYILNSSVLDSINNASHVGAFFNQSVTPIFGLVSLGDVEVGGVLSCTTVLSEVVSMAIG